MITFQHNIRGLQFSTIIDIPISLLPLLPSVQLLLSEVLPKLYSCESFTRLMILPLNLPIRSGFSSITPNPSSPPVPYHGPTTANSSLVASISTSLEFSWLYCPCEFLRLEVGARLIGGRRLVTPLAMSRVVEVECWSRSGWRFEGGAAGVTARRMESTSYCRESYRGGLRAPRIESSGDGGSVAWVKD